MIRVKLVDRTAIEIPRSEALELIPYRHLFTNPSLKSPIDGLLNHRGRIIPVLGPLPRSEEKDAPVDERPWILLMQGCAQVVLGLPEFDDAEEAENDNVVSLYPKSNAA